MCSNIYLRLSSLSKLYKLWGSELDLIHIITLQFLNRQFIRDSAIKVLLILSCKMIVEISVFLLLLTLLMIQIVRVRRQKNALLFTDWSRDLVYLAQFPPSPNVRSISPFSLKLETWLRLAKIPYKNIYTRKFAKSSHTIPYIELNGVQIADSKKEEKV